MKTNCFNFVFIAHMSSLPVNWGRPGSGSNLLPSLCMRITLHTCEDFAIQFNVKKTKCVLFNSHKSRCSHYPLFYLNGTPIEYVTQWSLLLNILDIYQDDSASILFRRHSLVDQVSDVICSLNKLSATIQIKLFYTYCSTFIQFCSLESVCP
jgi:hypothetical protein